MWLLLLLPFIGLLWVPFYNTDALPALFGFPFFYWYQLLWVPITAFLIWIVYRDGVRKGGEVMSADNINWTALWVFVFFFALVTVMGFWASRWNRSAKDGAHLD